MIDVPKIKKRLLNDYENVRVFFTPNLDAPILCAYNDDDDFFFVVSEYMDSEIGGNVYIKFLDEKILMRNLFETFGEAEALDAREVIIGKIKSGDVTIVGETKPEKLH